MNEPDGTLTETQEMILLTLARAQENGAAVSAEDLARELKVTPIPYLRVLLAQSLIACGSSDEFTLTDAGRQRALILLRRHRLAERLLTDVLGLDLVQAHEQADKLEHMVSAQAEQTMTTQLGDPNTCPHGNPIPNTRNNVLMPQTCLADCAPATRVMIRRIGLETPDVLRHLATLGLLPNTEIEIENQSPFDGPVMVRVGRAHYALGRNLAARIWVDPV